MSDGRQLARAGQAIWLTAAAAICAALLPQSLVAAEADAAQLSIKVTGIRGTEGNLIACLWRQADGFPTCQKSTTAVRQTLKIAAPAMTVRFNGIRPGSYVVTVQHDADADGNLRTNFLGIPREGVGISNNQGGIPRWSKSLVEVRPGATEIMVTMRYL